MRPCDVFLQRQGVFLSDYGFKPDPGKVEWTSPTTLAIYHYTHPERLETIFAPDGGLNARLKVVMTDARPEFDGCFFTEAFLEPLPRWITNSPYFGDLGLELMQTYVGTVLLRIEVPVDFPGLYIVDAAHNFDCKHVIYRGSPAMNLGYNCQTGEEVMLAELNSYLPLSEYNGGYVAPNVRVLRKGEGLTVPNQYFLICEQQPLKHLNEITDGSTLP